MKYLFAYTVPIVAIIGVYFGGIYTYAALFYAFGLIPIFELLLPVDLLNYNEQEVDARLKNKFFDYLLYTNLIIVYACVYYGLKQVFQNNFNLFEIIGTIFSVGIVCGANGINVAHELGHRDKKWERVIGKFLLVPSLYTHFYVEHNHGHHVHVSTPEDPSTARKNQNLYAFWWQTVSGTYTKAWSIQSKINKLENLSFFSLKNDMLVFSIVQVAYLAGIFAFFNTSGLFIALGFAVIGFLLLETINYIEHYGLQRKVLPSGRYERVTEKHSWNSNHVMGRILLYELTRHSDHHYKQNKKYQILEYHDVSPQMPYGYPTSMVLSLFPPLWYKVMNNKIPA
jgi:alkane 1-monooxygenase